MYLRALILGLAVFAVTSSAMAQTSPGAYYAEQKMRLDLLEKQGKITPAQRQAMELKLLKQLSGQSKGPKTGVYPQPVQGGNLQGSANAAAAQQAAAKAQADKSREALKRKAEGKKSKKGDKEDGEGEKKAGEKRNEAKKERKK